MSSKDHSITWEKKKRRNVLQRSQYNMRKKEKNEGNVPLLGRDERGKNLVWPPFFSFSVKPSRDELFVLPLVWRGLSSSRSSQSVTLYIVLLLYYKTGIPDGTLRTLNVHLFSEFTEFTTQLHVQEHVEEKDVKNNKVQVYFDCLVTECLFESFLLDLALGGERDPLTT